MLSVTPSEPDSAVRVPVFPQSQTRHRDLPAACWCTSSCGGSVVLAWRAVSLGRAQRAVLAKAPCWPPRPGSRRPHACASSAVRSHISPARRLCISGILLAVRSQSEGCATRNVPSYIRSRCPPLSRTALCTCVLILIPLKCSAYLSLCPSFQPPPPSPASGEHFLQVGTESQSKLCVFLNSRRSKNGQSQCFARSLLLHCGCFSAHSLKGEVVEI